MKSLVFPFQVFSPFGTKHAGNFAMLVALRAYGGRIAPSNAPLTNATLLDRTGNPLLTAKPSVGAGHGATDPNPAYRDAA